MTRRHLSGVVLLGALAMTGCAVTVAPSTAPRLCADKRPPKLLLEEECPGGVCGYTCARDRWGPPPVPREPVGPTPPIPAPEPVLRWELPITTTPIK